MIETSPDISFLSEALHKFQSEVVTVERSVVNPFFNRKYADLASIMLESQPILTKHRLLISQFPDNLNNKPALTTILMHSSGQFIKATILLPISETVTITKKEKTQNSPVEKEITSKGFDPQEFGRAITYMRRYGYAAVLQIVIDEDDDGNKSSKRQSEKPVEVPSNPETIEKIKTIWKENGGTEEKLDSWVKKNNNGVALTDLTGDRQEALLTYLEAKKAEKQNKPETNELSKSSETSTGNPEKTQESQS